jgi:hypothetical protein
MIRANQEISKKSIIEEFTVNLDNISALRDVFSRLSFKGLSGKGDSFGKSPNGSRRQSEKKENETKETPEYFDEKEKENDEAELEEDNTNSLDGWDNDEGKRKTYNDTLYDPFHFAGL